MTLEVSLCRNQTKDAYDISLKQQPGKDDEKISNLLEKVQAIFARIHSEMLWETITHSVVHKGDAPVDLLIVDLRSELTVKYRVFYKQLLDIMFGYDADYRKKIYPHLSPYVQSQLLKKIEVECIPELNAKFRFVHFTLDKQACLYASYKFD